MPLNARSVYLVLIALALPAIPGTSRGQSVVAAGAGSYASQVPVANYYTDSYYGLPAAQLEPLTSGTAFFNLLHLDPSLSGTAIPTNHWWTDMLFANRSYLPAGATAYVLQQDPYGGQMWVYPGMLQPTSSGLDLYFPNSWDPANANGSPQGNFNPGSALSIHGDRGYAVPSADILVADFEESTYPAGWTVTTVPGYPSAFPGSPAQGTWTGQSPTPAGYLGNGYINSYLTANNQGSNTNEGILSGTMTIQRQYINLLVGGGTDVNNTVVRLVVSGTTVETAVGQQDATLRWTTWDVSAYEGRTATIQIVDTSAAGWGFILCDEIVQSNSNQPSGRYGSDYAPENAIVTKWGDWNVDFKLPDGSGEEMNVTMARGIPYTWTTWQGGLKPKIEISGTTPVYDVNNNPITTGTSFATGAFSFNYQGSSYGIFLPPNTPVVVTPAYFEPQLSGSNNYMVVGYLPSTSYLSAFAAEAYARPTNTQISWSLDSAHGLVDTTWTITTTPLQGSNQSTIQGWLPHHYRTTTNNLVFTPYTFLTPRGTMRCAVGNTFQIDFPFKGIVPILPAPVVTGTTNPFQPARMLNFLSEFDPGTMLGDTYWSGKAMALCAQNMAWANQMQDTTDFLRLQSALETAMENWLTYTPGEQNGYFAWYPNFHAMIGWDASYGTQAFNDLHFHYGYFAVTGAILGMYDQEFLANYGPMLKLLVKCYGNFDRTDTSEPFLRMFDVWEGHSNAGGTSSPNGENQESSSEATQSWAGMFLLGNALKDSAMTAAGAMGFSMETAADNEYWEDLWQTNFPSGYGRGYAGQVYSSSYNYGTFFSGDPGWVYGIQYTPSNSWNNYLMRDQPATAASKFNGMYTERSEWCASQLQWTSTGTYPAGQWVQYDNSIYGVSGTTSVSGSAGTPAVDTNDWAEQADCSSPTPDILGSGLDHVILAFQGLWDFNNAAAEFDQYYAAGEDVATNTTDAGCTYYMIHSSRSLGNQDYNYTTSIPTSAVYLNPATGAETYVVFNPLTTTAPAIVYNNGVVTGTMTIPGNVLVSSTNPNYVPTAPSAPNGLQATAGYAAIGLIWNPVPGATSYIVERASVSGGPYTTIGTTLAASYMDSNVTVGSTYYYVVAGVNSIGQGANSNESAAAPLNPPAAAINCGGPAVSPFSGDVDYTGGSTSGVTNTVSLSGVTNPAPEGVYQTYRLGDFTYNITGLTPSTAYTARLHFAEDYFSAGGQREFNVSLNGTQVLTNFDIFAATGATYQAVVESYPVVSSSTGTVTVAFASVINNSACSGIELDLGAVPLAPTGLMANAGSGSITLSWTASVGATSYNVKRAAVSGGPYTLIGTSTSTIFTDSNVTAGSNYYYVVSGENSIGEGPNSSHAGVNSLGVLVMAINCGGPAVSPYLADVDYTGGGTSDTTATVNLGAVAFPAPESVYQTYRLGNFSYNITGLTANTNYTARLHFSEDYWPAAGDRVFNVSLSGTQVLTNFDIFATSGTNYTALVESFPVMSSGSGTLPVVFTTVKDNAACCGIEIDAVIPGTPTGLAAASGTGGVVLSWTASSGATAYDVQRGTESGGPYTVIATSTSTAYTDTTGTSGAIYYYVVSAVNGPEQSGNSAAVTVTVGTTPLMAWREGYFETTNPNDSIGGDTATPLGDGIPNLLKYSLGLDPLVPTTSGLPYARFAGGLLSITFTRMASATDITYHVQGSGDLKSWTEIWNSSGVAYGGGVNPSQKVTVTDSGGPEAGRRFLRLEITDP